MKFNLRRIKFYVFILFVAISLGGIIFSQTMGYNQDSIKNLLLKYYVFSAPLYILLAMLAISTTLPVTALIVAAMFIFPMYELIILTTIGIVLGTFFVFFITRELGEEAYEQYVKLKRHKLRAFGRLMKRDSTALVILLNFVYFFPSNLGGVVGGLTEMKFKKFALISIIGNFFNSAGLILITFGLYILNSSYLMIGATALFLNSSLPIYFLRRNIKEIWMLAFNRVKKELKEDAKDEAE